MDNLSATQRSYCMSQIRSINTSPEILVRCLIHKMGYRFRLHRKELPGKPDIVLSKHKKIIFVHGCFWHKHKCKYGKVIPKTNAKYWQKKIQGNVQKDRNNICALKKLGWDVLVVWECQLKKPEMILNKITTFLKN